MDRQTKKQTNKKQKGKRKTKPMLTCVNKLTVSQEAAWAGWQTEVGSVLHLGSFYRKSVRWRNRK